MKSKVFITALIFFLGINFISAGQHQSNSKRASIYPELSRKSAYEFSKLALKCVQKEYPNKLDHVMNNESEVLSPSKLHPAFYGCFDWHSSVHGHWMLVRLLKLFPDLENASDIRRVLNENLSESNIKIEVEYLNQPNRKSFERTYGWAWLLKLAEELNSWNDPQGKVWSENLKPLANAIVQRYIDFLPKQNYPIRTGVHPNTAFGISFALDYARSIKNYQLESLLTERGMTYYFKDENYDAKWEPGGEDFFSPALMEADLMRRIIEPKHFAEWFKKFLPDFSSTKSLLEPAIVTDRTDPKLVHLDGLNLSRAWCMFGIANNLPPNNPLREILISSAMKHAEAGLQYITSGNYEGEHWLASFAVYMLSEMK
ncbi:MAG: DUF2891 domain-containing protein [Ignavibacteria bacterium]|nr:DUF2891 domain-containing protein [Ignavibacteria bacterium]